jgi:hypothetical protein
VAVDGAFKIPSLRNVSLTGPYFHNGGQATLGQVIEFYDRQGDFTDGNIANVDPNMARVDLDEEDEEPLISFLISLTDHRVRREREPFDHPQLFVPNGHRGDHALLKCVRGVQACDAVSEIPATGEDGLPALGLPELKPFLGIDHLADD